MKVILISPYDKTPCIGLRTISSVLKNAGHDVKIVFLPISHQDHFSKENYDKKTVNDVVRICKSVDLVGITLMTNYFVKVAKLTEQLKKRLDVKVVWGGIHATSRPEECLEYADIVCIGDGEDAMVEFCENPERRDVKNLWFKDNGHTIKNELRVLRKDIDSLPFPDYSLEDHYVLDEGNVKKMSYSLLRKTMSKCGMLGGLTEYAVFTIRGCPQKCSYCCNSLLKEVYGDKYRMGMMSVERIIAELEDVVSKYPFIKHIIIEDDIFFMRSLDEIRRFSKEYKERVNLPFRCYACPQDVDEEKLKLLVSAGLYSIGVGIQSYSQKTLTKCYERFCSKKQIIDCVNLLKKYKEVRHPIYYVMFDNPYDTFFSMLKTWFFIFRLPADSVCWFPLTFFPNTKLYKRAKSDGFIDNEMREIYLRSWNNWKEIKYHTFLSRILIVTLSLKNKFRLKKQRRQSSV
ncbi:MAG: B12-binding domain-containing radical SAM protein [Nanoarchaeota archaeon]|nr:B12-binding domain-containing radical SAM protein [Nanoarchaeota archaeon]